MKIYLLTRSNGSVSIMRLLGDSTPEAEVAKWGEAVQATVVSIKEIAEAEIPVDRTFRNAWSSDPNGSLTIDMPKARNVWRDKIRAARAPLFAELDIEYLRAFEGGNEPKKGEVVAKKQLLRDLPQDPRIEAASTPEDLKKVWFEEFGSREPPSVPTVPPVNPVIHQPPPPTPRVVESPEAPTGDKK